MTNLVYIYAGFERNCLINLSLVTPRRMERQIDGQTEEYDDNDK
jgi:hypothetical protein